MAFRTNKMPVLQEKSASGAVATFNTALAMPLASCNIAVNAWQEGSGDPSPVNNRPIHGFSEVNPTRMGKNLFDIDNPLITAASQYTLNNYSPKIENRIFYNGGRIALSGGGGITIPAKAGINYTLSFVCGGEIANGTICAVTIDENNIWTSNTILANINGVEGKFQETITMPNGYTHLFFAMYSANRFGSWETDIQIEVGSTPTAYEPYVTPTIYTIQLGQEVYGAEVDAVNGVAHVNHKYILLSALGWSYSTGSVLFASESLDDIKVATSSSELTTIKSSSYKTTSVSGRTNYSIMSSTNKRIWIVDNDYTDANDFKTARGNTQIVYPLAEPFDIQLTPQQIETLIGNNTIFADTGDIDLTYKDLDIAKRGNFREVFKLPS